MYNGILILHTCYRGLLLVNKLLHVGQDMRQNVLVIVCLVAVIVDSSSLVHVYMFAAAQKPPTCVFPCSMPNRFVTLTVSPEINKNAEWVHVHITK